MTHFLHVLDWKTRGATPQTPLPTFLAHTPPSAVARAQMAEERVFVRVTANGRERSGRLAQRWPATTLLSQLACGAYGGPLPANATASVVVFSTSDEKNGTEFKELDVTVGEVIGDNLGKFFLVVVRSEAPQEAAGARRSASTVLMAGAAAVRARVAPQRARRRARRRKSHPSLPLQAANKLPEKHESDSTLRFDLAVWNALVDNAAREDLGVPADAAASGGSCHSMFKTLQTVLVKIVTLHPARLAERSIKIPARFRAIADAVRRSDKHHGSAKKSQLDQGVVSNVANSLLLAGGGKGGWKQRRLWRDYLEDVVEMGEELQRLAAYMAAEAAKQFARHNSAEAIRQSTEDFTLKRVPPCSRRSACATSSRARSAASGASCTRRRRHRLRSSACCSRTSTRSTGGRAVTGCGVLTSLPSATRRSTRREMAACGQVLCQGGPMLHRRHGGRVLQPEQDSRAHVVPVGLLLVRRRGLDHVRHAGGSIGARRRVAREPPRVPLVFQRERDHRFPGAPEPDGREASPWWRWWRQGGGGGRG